MSWITVIWSMNAGACLTLAAFYGAVWCKQRENRVYLLFSCSAAAAALISAFDLWMMQRRIAYDLHDGVGQQLVSIALSANLPEEQLRPDRPAEAGKASAIVRLANEAARQARLTARSLEGADGLGDLKTPLESLAMKISQNCRVRSMVKANGASLPVSAPVAAQLYRIAQEAVRNAVEHGAAREVLIQLTFGHWDMLLTIQDDGEGFGTKTKGHGMGRRIMRYRAQCIGGSCEVYTGASTVYCCVPLEAQPSLSTI